MKTSIILIALLISAASISQTNTFPADGNTGIGTTTPQGKLEVRGSGTIGGNWNPSGSFLKISDTANNSLIFDTNEIYGSGTLHIGSKSDEVVRFRTVSETSTTDLMVIEGNGNVGIGTMEPTSTLQVNGQTKVGYSGVLTLDWTNETNWGGSSNKWAGYIGFNAFRDNEDTKDYYKGTNRYTSKGVFEGSNYGFRWLYRNHNNYDSDGQHQLNEYMRLTNHGNLGIGTSTPSQKLEIFNPNPFNVNMENESQDHISLVSNEQGVDNYYGGITWKSAGRRRAAIAATREHTDSDYVGLAFFTQGTDGAGPFAESMRITRIGNVGIGTSNPDSKLTVKGKIHAEEVKIDLSVPAPDYVFTKDYDLLTIEKVQQHIAEKGHLPNIPSAKELEANGVELGMMNMKLLEKIEELTLYTIEQENKIKELEKQKEINQELKERLHKLEQIILKK